MRNIKERALCVLNQSNFTKEVSQLPCNEPYVKSIRAVNLKLSMIMQSTASESVDIR